MPTIVHTEAWPIQYITKDTYARAHGNSGSQRPTLLFEAHARDATRASGLLFHLCCCCHGKSCRSSCGGVQLGSGCFRLGIEVAMGYRSCKQVNRTIKKCYGNLEMIIVADSLRGCWR